MTWQRACHLLTLVALLLGAPFLIAADAPVQKGIVLYIGDIDMSVPIREVAKRDITAFVVLDDANKVRAARQAADRAGVLGTKVYVVQSKDNRIPLADRLVDEIHFGPKSRKEALLAEAKRLSRSPDPDTDDWSHPYHGPDNNTFSNDKTARGPFLTQFMAEPWYAAMPQMTVISGGRIFKVWGNRSSKQPSWDSLNKLICMNAFNGTTLWQRKLKPGFLRHRSTLVATPDKLFFADDTACQIIDPATGKTIDNIEIPSTISDGPVWKWMALDGGVLYALVGKKEPGVEVAKYRKDFRGAGWPWWRYKDYKFGFGRTVVAIDTKTKKILWHHREDDELDMRAMCMKAGRLYFHSRDKFLGCLDAKTGKLVWKSTDAKTLKAIGEQTPAQNPHFGFITTAYVKASDDALYFAGPMCRDLVAVSAKTGKYLWHVEGAGNSLLILRDDAVYAMSGGRLNKPRYKTDLPSMKLEPLTGKILAEFGSRDRCTRATGCLDMIFTRGGRGGSTAVFDISSTKPKMGLITPMRPACQDGVLVAHGQLFWGPWMCRCDATQIGVISLSPAGDFQFGQVAKEAVRLDLPERAQRQVEAFAVGPNDWPMLRRDNQRSAKSPVAIPDDAKLLWTHTPTNKSVGTSPVIAGGLVFSSGLDGAVRALDADSGKVRWTAYTGGAIRYPPAIAHDRAYVGSGDGYVYCFEAATGRRLWRFRVAPVDRRIPVFGSVISTWPIGSGVLVEDGVVYAAAGNANYNGTHVVALDAITGKIRWQNNDSGHKVADASSGAGVQGHLLMHDDHLWMQGGNLTGLVTYAKKDGTFQRRGRHAGRYGNLSGKDLFLFDDKVHISGLPLYFRQEDAHFIDHVDIPTKAGVVSLYSLNPNVENPTVLVAMFDPQMAKKQRKPIWRQRLFTENNAVAVTSNAVVVAGVDRTGTGPDTKTTASICALDLKTGKKHWEHDLPAAPSGWGIAVDARGRVIVALQDGRVLAFGTNK